ncbi:MAG: histidine phosphatase family protein [Burkholderiaceae bacterium]
MLNRRAFALSLPLMPAALPVFAQADPAAELLKKGGVAIVIRHARTVAGVGDPDGFRIDLCSTQRNLSEEGRAQAKKIGEWFRRHGLQPRAVQVSAWCRCKDTADLAFGRHLVWPALNSFFDGRSSEPRQTAALKEALKGIAPGRFEAWVTHQVNITALTGENPAQGEGLIVDAAGKVVGRTSFN